MEQTETINYKLYLKDEEYKRRSNLVAYWEQMQRYFEGTKQYEDNLTPYLPKSVNNLCKFVALNKTSKVIGTPYTIAFQTANDDRSTLNLQRFYKYIMTTMQDSVFNHEAVLNGSVFGTEITYITYDRDYTTFKALTKGGFKEIHINLKNVAFENPKERDIQKQGYILYWTDENIESVRNLLERKEKESDKAYKERQNKIQPDEDDFATIYTRFFRVNGEVYYQTSTKEYDLYDPKPLSPFYKNKVKFTYNEKKNDYEEVDSPMIDTQSTDNKKMSEKEYLETIGKFSMYPFAIYRPLKRIDNIYGISEIQDLIGNQQIINALISYMAYDIKINAAGKYVVKSDSLKGQMINDKPGQIIMDYSKVGQGFGIKRLEGTTIATNIMGYVNQLFGLTRTLHGTTELFTGDRAGDLSGTAISLLQREGNTVIEQQQKNFNDEYCVDKAKIILQYIMHYVDEETFIYEKSQAEYQEENLYRDKLIELDKNKNPEQFLSLMKNDEEFEKVYPKVSKCSQITFKSKNIRNKIFHVSPKSGRGIRYSEIIQADFLQKLLMNGGIEKYSSDQLEFMLEILPLVDDTTRANLKVLVDKMRHSQISELKGVIAEREQQLYEAATINKKYQAHLEYLKNYNKELTKQFSERLDIARTQQQPIHNHEVDLSDNDIQDLEEVM